MADLDNLNKIYEEMVKHIKSCGLRVFPTLSGEHSLAEELPNVMIWDSERDDWTSFIEIAKEEGVKTIIVETIRGKDENHADDIGSITLAWIKEGIIYAFEKYTEWSVEPPREEVAPSIGVSYGREEQISKEALEELQNKDENQLAEEMLAFVSKEFPDLDRVGLYHKSELFWNQKGIGRWRLEPKLQFKIEKVDTIFREKLEQELAKKVKEQIEKEKEILPKLIEECLEWAKKNQIKKVTKSNIDYFLTEKEIGLTKISRDIMYNQVNFKIQRE